MTYTSKRKCYLLTFWTLLLGRSEMKTDMSNAVRLKCVWLRRFSLYYELM